MTPRVVPCEPLLLLLLCHRLCSPGPFACLIVPFLSLSCTLSFSTFSAIDSYLSLLSRHPQALLSFGPIVSRSSIVYIAHTNNRIYLSIYQASFALCLPACSTEPTSRLSFFAIGVGRPRSNG